MTEMEVVVMKIMNSCMICVVLMQMMTPQLVFELIKQKLE